MNVKQVACKLCGNNSFHTYQIKDNGVYLTNEHVCTQCGAHYSIEQISSEYTTFWNEFVAGIDKGDDIECVEV